MNVFQDIWRDLIEKKLWLVALPLVVLTLAVPMAIGSSDEIADVPVPPPAEVADGGPALNLTATSTTGFARAPRVNNKRLNPFAARTNPSLAKTAEQLGEGADAVIDGGQPGSAGGPSMPSAPGGSGGPPSGERPQEPKAEYETDDLLSVVWHEGDADAKPLEDLRTLTPLPDADEPFLVYVGKTKSGRASFLVSADVKVTGQGACTPSRTDCRTLEMKVGDTAVLELLTKPTGQGGNTEVKLTVSDIERKKVLVNGDGAEANALETRARVAGAKALKSVLDDELIVGALKRQAIRIR